jgi:hypothetical protein
MCLSHSKSRTLAKVESWRTARLTTYILMVSLESLMRANAIMRWAYPVRISLDWLSGS